jgi:hypothetical protein
MIKVIGHWDIWQKPTQEYTNWVFLVKHFGVDDFYMIPNTGLGLSLKNDQVDNIQYLYEIDDINDVIGNIDFIPVILDENGDVELIDLVHPENAIYILGRVGYSPKENLNTNIISVRIPSWSKDVNSSNGLLHPHQALAIVLYDREIKQYPVI